MNETVATGLRRPRSIDTALTWVAYAVLGSILCWTRLVGLDRSLWLDEIITVENYVREGPRVILAGPYLKNNHELFSMLAWITSSAAGDSEIALRFWSVAPFLAGVALVTAWVHMRVGRLAGVLFLFLATGSPLLLDITPTARGYGLAFLAMSMVVVGALEADRSGRRSWIIALFAGGIIGMWTLPNFAVAFFATIAVLLFNAELRRRVLIGTASSALAAIAWYAPHLDDLAASSGQGVEIGLVGLVTSPIDHVLVPALLWYDGVVPAEPLVLFPVAVLALVVMASSPLLGRNRSTAILTSGAVVTMLVLWYLRLPVVPRFLSYLLVPMFVLAASGAASILAPRTTRPPLVRAVVVLSAIGVLAYIFTPAVLEISRFPREANKDAAMLIHAEAPAGARIYPHMAAPRTLAFYLREPLERAPTQSDVRGICASPDPVVLVDQPFRIQRLRVPCLGRAGVRRYRVEQYARGDEINVWLIAPR